jgi:hypothetical protein
VGYGGGTDWCVGENLDSVTPQVTRRNASVLAIACRPRRAYGVSFGPSAAVDLARPTGTISQYGDQGYHPDGAWLSIVVEGDVALTVVTRERVHRRADRRLRRHH